MAMQNNIKYRKKYINILWCRVDYVDSFAYSGFWPGRWMSVEQTLRHNHTTDTNEHPLLWQRLPIYSFVLIHTHTHKIERTVNGLLLQRSTTASSVLWYYRKREYSFSGHAATRGFSIWPTTTGFPSSKNTTKTEEKKMIQTLFRMRSCCAEQILHTFMYECSARYYNTLEQH